VKNKKGKKRNILDYYRERGIRNPRIIQGFVPMSRKTLSSLRRLARRENVSVNYLIAFLINHGAEILRVELDKHKQVAQEEEVGVLILEIVPGGEDPPKE